MANELIPGIYHYCDRWCEKCPFTGRCSLFLEALVSPADHLQQADKAFWERLSTNFSKAKKLLEEAALKAGIELEEDEDQTAVNRWEVNADRCSTHPLSVLSLDYSLMAQEWLKTQPGMLDRLERLKDEITMGTQSHESATEETALIKDSLAIIQWYASFIHVKLMRALMGKYGEPEVKGAGAQQEFNGAAKIAAISIETSRRAWENLFSILPEQEDDFLKALSALEKIKSLIREEFPEADNFIRPGFDEH